MKAYPSIPRAVGTTFFEIPNAYLFRKEDGSLIRAKHTKKKGWELFGTKHTIFDASDPLWGKSIQTFYELGLADGIAEIAMNNNWRETIAFMEWHGEGSFAGIHKPDDIMTMTLFDVNVHKQGILSPKQFLKLFKYLPIAKFLGQMNWTRGLVERIFNGEIDCGSEGVVAKAGEGHHLVMAKAKLKSWLDKVRALHTPEQAELIINS